MNAARADKRRQGGATVVEFALVLLIFLTVFLGLLDFSRMLYLWNAASHAAHEAARFAVVCDDTSRADQVLARAQAWLPQVKAITVQWQPAACDPLNCLGVQVSIEALDEPWMSPMAGLAALLPVPMPRFTTYLPREAMRGDPHSQQLCSS